MTADRPARVAVVGAGVSGLTAAYQLRLGLPDAGIVVLEAADRPGGKLDTVDFPSGPMELGAEAFIGRRPEAAELVEELGLAEALHHPGPSLPAILTGGRLVPMPAGTVMGLPSEAAALSGVLSGAELERAAGEEHLPLDWTPGGDAAVGDLVAERFGPALVARLVDPMLGGVYAAPSAGLSLREVVPGLAGRLDAGAPSLTAAVRELVADRMSGPVFATFDGGYRRFVAALADASGAEVRTGTRCTGITAAGDGFRVETAPSGTAASADVLEVDVVVVAVPVPDAVPLVAGLGGLAREAADLYDGVRTASSAVVALELDRAAELPAHSGVLVATDEPVPYKAMTFSSRKWPHLDDRPGHLVRVSFGRLGADAVLARPDAEIDALAREALGDVVDGPVRILHSRVRRWEDGLAEITPGHDDLVTRVRALLADAAPGVELVGAATEGVGVPACIGSARAAARRLAARWQD